MFPIALSSRAELDLAEIADYLGERNPDAAVRVLDSLEATLHKLALQPEIGVHPAYLKRPEDSSVRMKPDSQFPSYLVFYEVIGDRLQIHRVIHGSRDLPAAFENPEAETRTGD